MELLAIFRKKQESISIKHTCHTLPIEDFIRVLVTGILIPNWSEIYSEYIELSGDTSTNRNLSYMREIAVLTNKLILAEALVQQLDVERNEGLITALKTLGFRLSYSEETMQSDLINTINQCKALLITLNQRKHELQEMQSENKAPTQSDYDVYLSELNKFQNGCRIVTVAEFCAVAKRFKQQNKIK